jgi:hypothetical protein
MQGRNLVAERFTATGRHDKKNILAGDYQLNDILLGRAEVVETKDGFEGVVDG